MIKDERFGAGLKLCRKALVLAPDSQKAHMSCAIAACYLRRGTIAKKHIDAIDSNTRALSLSQVCLRLDVKIGEEQKEELTGPRDEIEELIAPRGERSDSEEEQQGRGEETSAECTLQEKPRRSDITAVIAELRSQITSCGDQHATLRGTYKIKFKVEPSGSVKILKQQPKDALGQCLTREVRAAHFVETCQGTTVTYPFVFRYKEENEVDEANLSE